jgi:hypothetical protein
MARRDLDRAVSERPSVGLSAADRSPGLAGDTFEHPRATQGALQIANRPELFAQNRGRAGDLSQQIDHSAACRLLSGVSHFSK